MTTTSLVRLGVLLGFVSLAALAGGCGGSDDDTAASAGGGSAGTTGGGAGKSGAGGAGASGTGGTGGSTAGKGGGGAGGGAGAGALDMFAAWKEARASLRASPDHLLARADEVVASKDPKKIFELVRDQIATHPPSEHSWLAAVTAQRWGARGTLRGGAGTPREKAELLAQLYGRAGLSAEVVAGPADPAKVDAHRALLRSIDRPFAPPATAAQKAAWLSALGHTAPTPHAIIDPTGADTQALAASLAALLPTSSSSPFDFTLGDIPLVKVTVNGAATYANPVDPALPFGERGTIGEPSPAPAADAPMAVHVKLELARADAPFARFPVVEGTFDAADVVGRRVQITFPPPADLRTLAGMPLKNVSAVVPRLAVVGPDMTKDEKTALSKIGDLLTLDGDVFATDAGGLSRNGAPFATGVTDPATLAKVASVSSRVSAATFSTVTVGVSAKDAGGLPVSHLAASAFELREDGQRMSFTLSKNEPEPPRVLVLYDVSTSLPPEYMGAGAAALGDSLVDAIYAKYPKAQIRAATVFFGAGFATDGWATTPAEAKAQIATAVAAPGDSSIWQALYEVEKESPTVIVMLSDGVAEDMPKTEYVSAIATGAPVVSLGVGTVSKPTLDQLTATSGGTTVVLKQPSDANAPVLAAVDARAGEDYLLTYRAPKAGMSKRTVSVTVNAKSASGTYDVPPAPALPRGLSGAYLTIGVGDREETFPVAGYPGGPTTDFPAITAADLDDVRGLLLGRVSVAVEGAAVPPSILVDEWIGEKLALEPLWKAAVAKDEKAVEAELAKGFTFTPAPLPVAQPPLRDAASKDALTFETAPRVAALVQKTRIGGPVTKHLNIFPLSRWATAADDPKVAFQKTLAATTSLAVVESGLFKGPSTQKLLAGKALTAYQAGTIHEQPGLSPADAARWAALEEPFGADYTLLATPTPGAFWAVHRPTGTVIGVLQDGSGGGAGSACDTYNATSNFISAMGLMGELMGVELGGWVALAEWEAKYVTMATMVLEGQLSPGDVNLTNPAVDMACGEFGDPIGDALPDEIGIVDGVLGAGGVDSGLPDTSLCGGGGGDICQ